VGSTARARDEGCAFCGRKNYLGYHYTCHVCGASYCYTHMERHARAHPRTVPSYVSGLEAPVQEAPHFDILTEDPDEVRLITRFVLNLLGPMGRPRPLEGLEMRSD